MLDFEVEGNIIGKKIESDFETLSNKDLPFLEDFYVGKMVDYKFSHPFGIVTKKDILKSFRVNIMLTVSSMEISDNWIEFFWEKPYSDYHLTFLNHSLWDHCQLSTKEILKMKLKRFSLCFKMEW